LLKENAFVVDVADGVAWVETQRKSTCGSCAARNGCGTSVLQKVMGNKRTRLKVDNPNQYSVGDEVILGLQENALIKGSLLLYALPIVAMFGFSLIANVIFNNLNIAFTEGYSILFSLIGLMFGFWLVMKSSGKLRNNESYQAKILEKVVSIRSLHEKN